MEIKPLAREDTAPASFAGTTVVDLSVHDDNVSGVRAEHIAQSLAIQAAQRTSPLRKAQLASEMLVAVELLGIIARQREGEKDARQGMTGRELRRELVRQSGDPMSMLRQRTAIAQVRETPAPLRGVGAIEPLSQSSEVKTLMYDARTGAAVRRLGLQEGGLVGSAAVDCMVSLLLGSVDALSETVLALESSPLLFDLATALALPKPATGVGARGMERDVLALNRARSSNYELVVGRVGSFDYRQEKPVEQNQNIDPRELAGSGTEQGWEKLEMDLYNLRLQAEGSSAPTAELEHRLNDLKRQVMDVEEVEPSGLDSGAMQDVTPEEDLVLVFDLEIEDIFEREEQFAVEVLAHVTAALVGGKENDIYIQPGWVSVTKLEKGSIRVYVKFGQGPSCGGKGGGITAEEAVLRLHALAVAEDSLLKQGSLGSKLIAIDMNSHSLARGMSSTQRLTPQPPGLTPQPPDKRQATKEELLRLLQEGKQSGALKEVLSSSPMIPAAETPRDTDVTEVGRGSIQSYSSDVPVDWGEPLYHDRMKNVDLEVRLEPQAQALLSKETHLPRTGDELRGECSLRQKPLEGPMAGDVDAEISRVQSLQASSVLADRFSDRQIGPAPSGISDVFGPDSRATSVGARDATSASRSASNLSHRFGPVPSVSDKFGPAASAMSDRFVPVPSQPQDVQSLQLDRSSSWVPGDALSRSASSATDKSALFGPMSRSSSDVGGLNSYSGSEYEFNSSTPSDVPSASRDEEGRLLGQAPSSLVPPLVLDTVALEGLQEQAAETPPWGRSLSALGVAGAFSQRELARLSSSNRWLPPSLPDAVTVLPACLTALQSIQVVWLTMRSPQVACGYGAHSKSGDCP